MLPPDDPDVARRLGLTPRHERAHIFLGVIYVLIIFGFMLVSALMIKLVDQWIAALLYGVVTMALGALVILVNVWSIDPNFFAPSKPNAPPDV